jgi:hypothetical protein
MSQGSDMSSDEENELFLTGGLQREQAKQADATSVIKENEQLAAKLKALSAQLDARDQPKPVDMNATADVTIVGAKEEEDDPSSGLFATNGLMMEMGEAQKLKDVADLLKPQQQDDNDDDDDDGDDDDEEEAMFATGGLMMQMGKAQRLKDAQDQLNPRKQDDDDEEEEEEAMFATGGLMMQMGKAQRLKDALMMEPANVNTTKHMKIVGAEEARAGSGAQDTKAVKDEMFATGGLMQELERAQNIADAEDRNKAVEKSSKDGKKSENREDHKGQRATQFLRHSDCSFMVMKGGLGLLTKEAQDPKLQYKIEFVSFKAAGFVFGSKSQCEKLADGKLKPGMVCTKVNEKSMRGVSYKEAKEQCKVRPVTLCYSVPAELEASEQARRDEKAKKEQAKKEKKEKKEKKARKREQAAANAQAEAELKLELANDEKLRLQLKAVLERVSDASEEVAVVSPIPSDSQVLGKGMTGSQHISQQRGVPEVPVGATTGILSLTDRDSQQLPNEAKANVTTWAGLLRVENQRKPGAWTEKWFEITGHYLRFYGIVASTRRKTNQIASYDLCAIGIEPDVGNAMARLALSAEKSMVLQADTAANMQVFVDAANQALAPATAEEKAASKARKVQLLLEAQEERKVAIELATIKAAGNAAGVAIKASTTVCAAYTDLWEERMSERAEAKAALHEVKRRTRSAAAVASAAAAGGIAATIEYTDAWQTVTMETAMRRARELAIERSHAQEEAAEYLATIKLEKAEQAEQALKEAGEEQRRSDAEAAKQRLEKRAGEMPERRDMALSLAMSRGQVKKPASEAQPDAAVKPAKLKPKVQKTAFVPGTCQVCKVLVTGESRANTNAIVQMLQQIEEEIDPAVSPGLTMDVTVVPLGPCEIREPDKHLPKKLSQFHAILMAFDAKPVYLAICGGTGKLDKVLIVHLAFDIEIQLPKSPHSCLTFAFLPSPRFFPHPLRPTHCAPPTAPHPLPPTRDIPQVIEKLSLTAVPTRSIYFIATGDRDASTLEEQLETGELYDSVGNLYDSVGESGATPFRNIRDLNTEVHVQEEEDVLISEGLMKRLGPMQLAHLQDYINGGQCLAWKDAPLKVQRKHMKRHMQHLTYNKPMRSIDSNNFRCVGCKREFTLVEIKDFLAMGANELNRGAAMCPICSCGHCGHCGEQLPVAKAVDHFCMVCGMASVSVTALIPANEIQAEQEVSVRVKCALAVAVARFAGVVVMQAD